MSDENRLFLKTELIRRIREDLDAQDTLFMQQHSRIYQIIQQLEEINPNPQPLTSKNLSKLVGDWKVLYSIKRHRTPLGTQTVSNKGTGIDIRIMQNLTLNNSKIISSADTVFIELTAFAEWKIEVEGVWNIKDNKTALVKLKTFEFKLPQPFFIPEFKIPLFELFPIENLWKIYYLDEDMLFGKDENDTLFIFCNSR